MWWLAVWIACLAGVVPARAASNTNLVFIRQPDFNLGPSGFYPHALADLNHDGIPDLIHVVDNNRIAVQLGLGNGLFGTAAYYNTGTQPAFIQVADMNHDGIPDVVVANLNDTSVTVYPGNGDGTLQAGRTTQVGIVVTDMAATDYNKDGNQDLILVGYRVANGPLDGYVVTLPGSGDGYFGTATGFTPSVRTSNTGTRGLAVGDLNGDGYPDFVVSDPGSGHAIVSFLNNKNGTFTSSVEMQIAGVPGRIAMADFNNDGKMDLAIVTAADTMYGNTGDGNNVEVVLGNGDGTFGTLGNFGPIYPINNGQVYSLDAARDSMVSPGVNILVSDLDGDGVLDIAVCAQVTASGANYVGILRGASNGTFTPAAQLGADSLSFWLSAGDLNRDGVPDLVGTVNGPSVQTFLGLSPGNANVVVTTAVDEDNGTISPTSGTGTSLREAWNYVNGLTGPQTIYFSANLAGQVIRLTTAAYTNYGPVGLRVTPGHNITLQGTTGSMGVTISGNNQLRPFEVGYDINTGQFGTFAANDLTITGGTAQYGGAIHCLGAMTLKRCTLTGNYGTTGSGLYLDGSLNHAVNAYMENCTIANNSAGASAVVNDTGTLYLQHVTITGNYGGGGGGLGSFGGASTTISNCIIAGNTGFSAANDISATVTAASRGNVIGVSGTGGLTSGVNNNYVGVPTNVLMLGPLMYNGGSTPTMIPLAGSFLIDLGLPAGGLTADQRGFTYSGPPDIGAGEAVNQAPFFNSAASTVFISGSYSNFQALVAGYPTSTITETGTLPSGVTLSANGSLAGTAAIGTEGIYPITLTAANGVGSSASQSFTLVVRSAVSLGVVVTTLTDDNDGNNNLVSLREAITNAVNLGGSQTITFASSLFTNGPGTLLLTNAGSYKALILPTANSKLTIMGPGPKLLTITSGGLSPIVNAGGPNIELDNLTLANGYSSVGYGGAIIAASGLTCSNVYFLNNSSDGSSSTAGAIGYVGGGTLNLMNCLFSNNVASGSGGAVLVQSGSAVINGCTFVQNRAGQHGNGTVNTSGPNYGGAIYDNSLYNALLIKNSTFVGNSVGNGYGGALAASYLSGTLANSRLVNCTLSGNTADLGGGGVEVTNSVYALQVYNTIISGNTAPGNSNVDASGGLCLATNCLIDVSAAAIFGTNTLADNGGLTPTLAILATGPAFDGGNSSLVPAGVTVDQRGMPRLFGAAVDIGAYEVEYTAPVITSAGSVTFLRDHVNSFTFGATGFPTPTVTVNGTLPASLTVDAGTLSGTPGINDVGTYNLTITADNGWGTPATQNFTLVVAGPETLAAPLTFNTGGAGWNIVGNWPSSGPTISGNAFTLTDGSAGENTSAWFQYPLYAAGFQASFTYQDVGGNGADGVAFVLQNSAAGPKAIGAPGGGLGYDSISSSVAVMFNIYGGSPGGPSGVLVATNGVGPGAGYWPSIYQNTAPVDLDAGNPVNVTLRYVQHQLQISLTDTVTSATYTTNVMIDATNYLGSESAYVGVTGSEGGVLSRQVISNFNYAPLPWVQAVSNAAGQVTLQWSATVYGFRVQGSVPGSGVWSDVGGTVTQSDGVNQLTLPTTGSAQIYRLAL